jgi:hypothetical protein
LVVALALTPEQRRLRGQIAGNERWSRVPKAERATHTEAARKAFRDRFADAADPEAAMRAHMARLSLKASKARRKGTVP